jgi:hypothetical protein
MNENLNQDQFGDKPKKRWVPDQPPSLLIHHILTWHTKASGPNQAKGLDRRGLSQYDDKGWIARHEQEHAEGNFEEGHEHEHFTPKKRK